MEPQDVKRKPIDMNKAGISNLGTRARSPSQTGRPIPDLLIWGASGHAAVVAEIVRLTGGYHVAGFIDDLDQHVRPRLGSHVLGGREVLRKPSDGGIRHVIVAIGDCRVRAELAAIAQQSGFTLATVIHPAAVVADDVTIGAGCVLCAGSVVSPGAVIGDNVILNTCSSVDHDCIVGNGAHLGPGAHIGGWVQIGAGTFLGIGAVVKDHVSIGAHVTIGAGAAVVGDIEAGVVAYGVPARPVRHRPGAPLGEES